MLMLTHELPNRLHVRHGRHHPRRRTSTALSTSARPSTRIRRWASIGMAAEVAHGSCTDVPACAQVSPQPSYPDKARTGDGSGLVLCVPKQSPQNTVHLYSIHANHCKTQTLQPTPPRTHAAVPNGSRALRDLARVGQRGSVRRPGRPPPPQALRAQSVCQSILSAASLPMVLPALAAATVGTTTL